MGAHAGLEYTDAMAQGYALAANDNYAEAVAAGERALKAIKDSRMLEPGPYVNSLWCREELNWLWYNKVSHDTRSEKRTQDVIKSWREKVSYSESKIDNWL